MKRIEVIPGTLVSVVLVVGAWQQFLPLSLTEVFGFITGALCVWLTVKQNIWTWPTSIANNIFFIVLFLQAQLYADMSLQVVYIVLEVLGWYRWLHGGNNSSRLSVSKASAQTLAILGLLLIGITFGMTLFLESVNDSAPFLDGLTTVMSLIAQYMLTRKLIENWYIWIAADVIYIGLYAAKGLYLTSGLYFLFLCMCLAGLWSWRKDLLTSQKITPTVTNLSTSQGA
ncbi:MAG: nicotinamide riboside transporter PnuC [Chloroflexota bacterium]|nr:nicotinamide mononucleotide transporter [Chloroflexota bacterium]